MPKHYGSTATKRYFQGIGYSLEHDAWKRSLPAAIPCARWTLGCLAAPGSSMHFSSLSLLWAWWRKKTGDFWRDERDAHFLASTYLQGGEDTRCLLLQWASGAPGAELPPAICDRLDILNFSSPRLPQHWRAWALSASRRDSFRHPSPLKAELLAFLHGHEKLQLEKTIEAINYVRYQPRL